jgi:O-succinylbenzoate synthase
VTTSTTTQLPSLEEVLAGAVAFRVSLKVPFRNVTERTGLLLHGPAGWGEFAPFPDYDAPGAAAWLAAGVEAAYVGWPDPVRESIGVNGIVPDGSVADAERFAQAAVDSGVSILKIKVAGHGVRQVTDLLRLRAIGEVVGPGMRLRLDANGGWSVDEALQMLEAIGDLNLEYVEQPCATLAECAIVKETSTRRVAVDEGLRRAQDVDDEELHDRIREAANFVIVKAPPLGGVRRAMRVARTLGLPIVVSGAMDTSVGLAAGVALAAALPGTQYSAGLGTGALLNTDVTTVTELPQRGRLKVRPIEPDDAPLAAAHALVSRADDDALRARLVSAWNAGAMRMLEAELS